MSWAEDKYKELMAKKEQGIPLTEDDFEALAYCEECFAEDERDAEYIGNYTVLDQEDLR